MNYIRFCIFYFLCLVIPAEFYFLLGEVRFEIYRICLIISFFIVCRFIRDIRPGFVEYLLLAYCLWCVVSFIYVKGSSGIQSGLILFLEVFVSFYLGRIALEKNYVSFKSFITVVACIFLFLAPFGIDEAITGYRYFHVFFGELAGSEYLEQLSDSYIRMNMHRSSTVFAHPILYAIVAATFVPFVFLYFKGWRRLLLLSGLLTAVIVAVSSVAYLMLLMQFGLYLLERINTLLPFFRKYVFVIACTILAGLQLFTAKGALLFLILNVSLNPHTAYYRYLQWFHAWDDVLRYSFFGMASNSKWTRPWWMIQSVDSYWLSAFLMNGLYSTYILLCVWILVLVKVFRTYINTGNKLAMTFYFSFASLLLGSATVDFFDRVHPITYLFIGFIIGLVNVHNKNLSRTEK